jgi:hypothetical protein
LAHLLAAGKSQQLAYKEAGYTGESTAASTKMANRADVKARTQEIIATQHKKEIRSNERAIEKAAIDKGYIVSRLQYAAELGLRGKPLLGEDGKDTGRWSLKPDIKGAVGALRTLAQMGGHLIERHEIGSPGDFARLTDDELDLKLIEVGEAIGISGPELQRALAGPKEDAA